MIEIALTISIITLLVCSILSLCYVVTTWNDDPSHYRDEWPTDGITREPKQGK